MFMTDIPFPKPGPEFAPGDGYTVLLSQSINSHETRIVAGSPIG
jgi:hypothetical protein